MTIDLSTLEKLATPRRGRCRKKPVTVSPEELSARLAEVSGSLSASDRELLAKAGPVGEAVLAFVAQGPLASLPRHLDLQVQARLATTAGLDVGPKRDLLLPLWLEVEGPAFAVDALALAMGDAKAHSEMGEWSLQRSFPRWAALREQLAIAPEPAWHEARERAARLFASASITARCGLAYLFPEEPGWASRAARDWLERENTPPAPGIRAGSPFAGYVTLASLDDPALVVELCAHARRTAGYAALGDLAADAAFLHRDAALAALLEVFAIADLPRDTWGWARAALVKIAKVIACFGDPRAVAALADKLDHKVFGPTAVEQLERFPQAALAVLAPSLGAKSKTAERRVALLDALLRAQPALVESAVLPPDQARAVRLRFASLHPTTPASTPAAGTLEAGLSEAARADWPAVLADPPWRSKAPRPTPPRLPGVAVAPRAERLVLDEETRTRWEAAPNGYGPPGQPRDAQLSVLAMARANRERTTKLGFADYATAAFLQPLFFSDDLLAEMWALPPFSSTFDLASAQQTLARLGEAALSGAVARLEVEPSLLPLVLHLDTNRVSVHIARALRRPSHRGIAQRALARFPETHAPALAAIALSGEPRDAELAGHALRWLATQGAEGVLDGAATLGPAVRDAIASLLAIDPLQVCPAKPPRLSDFADPQTLPRARLRDQRALPLEAMRNLLEMLQFSPIDPRYLGIDQVVSACDPGSLDELAWALLQAWDRAGGASGSAWAIHALGHIGSDALVKRLAGEIRRWPREKAKSRALLGLEVLARMGTDLALLHLDELAKKARNRDVEARAAELLAIVAEARGLSPLDLEDRLVPTLDLDARGGRTIEVGARSLRVCFDPYLEPYLVEVAGPAGEVAAGGRRVEKILKQKGDDPDALKRAQEAWKELRADAAAITKALTGRVERAMCEERRWDGPTFRALFATHPLTQHLARHLVWGVFEQGLRATFRIAEDGTLADVDDAPLVLGANAQVGIVHPILLAEPLLATWRQRFSDYEILQPFEQLARVVTLAEGDGSALLERARDREVALGALLGGLEARGWRLTSPDGDGVMNELTRSIAGVTAWLSFSPGFRPREERPAKVALETPGFYGVKTPAAAPPLAYSELVRDLSVFGLAGA